MKKPFLKFKSFGDRMRVVLFFVLLAFAISLFLMPQEAKTAMSLGGAESPKSLFGLITRLA